MKNIFALLAALIISVGTLHATTVGGTIVNSSSTVQPSGYVTFEVVGCSASQMINTSNQSVVTPSYTFTANTSGVWNGTVVGNDIIKCPNTGATQYRVTQYSQSNQLISSELFTLVNSSNFNPAIGTSSVVTKQPAMINPLTTQGDLIFGGSNGIPSRLPIGTTATCLESNGAIPYWGTCNTSSGGGSSGGGTTSTIGLSAPNDFTVGSPITGSGSLAFAWVIPPTPTNTQNAIVERDSNGSIAVNEVTLGSDSPTGTQAADANFVNNLFAGLGTMSTQSAANVALTGGFINGTEIGNITPALGFFTGLQINSNSSVATQLVFVNNSGATNEWSLNLAGSISENGLPANAFGVMNLTTLATPFYVTSTSFVTTVPMTTPSITINGHTAITSTSSSNAQAVTCPIGGTSNQYCSAAGVWVTPSAGAGTGTVTSIGLSLPADFNVTGSPITSSGTLTAAYATTPTGTGAFVKATSPTLVTPILGAATLTSFRFGSGTVLTSTSSANPQIVTCPTGGTTTQYCDAAGAWVTPSTGSGGGLGSVTLSGTPVVGAVPLGTTSTTAAWSVPPSDAIYTINYHSAGTDICSWIAAAMAALPSAGGAVSTAGEANFASTNQCSAANTRAMFAGSYGGTDKFTHLYIGAQTIQIPVQLVIPYGSEISGINLGFPSDGGSVIQATSTYVASEPYTSVSCSSTTQLCTVTTSAPTGVVVGSQILVVPTTASNVPPFAQIVTSVTSSTQFVFPEWINCNNTPDTANCAGGTPYPAATYASLTTGTIILPIVAVGDIQFSEQTRIDHMTIDAGNITTGESIGFFSQTMNENSGSNSLLINSTTYAGFDIEAGGNSATLGSGNYDFNYISVGPTAGVCGRVVEAYGNEYRGIHEITCNAFTSPTPLAQGIIFDGPDGENGPFHFENFVDAVVLQGSFPQNVGVSGEGLGSAFTIYDVTCFNNVTNCVHNLTSSNTPVNFTLRDIQANGATNVYKNAAGTVYPGNYIVNYVDGVTDPITTTILTATTVNSTNGVFTNPISAGGFGVCTSDGTNCPASILSVGIANTGNGISGTSSGGTAPVLSIALGDITPTGFDLSSTDTVLSDTIATFMQPNNPGTSSNPGTISFQIGHDTTTGYNAGIFTFIYGGSGNVANSFSFGVNGGTEVNVTSAGLLSAPGGLFSAGVLTAASGVFSGSVSANGFGLCQSNGANCPSNAGIANVQVTLPTTSIAANSCTTAAAVTMTGVTLGSTFTTAFSSNPLATLGWGSQGGLVFEVWPTANTANWSVCNQTNAAIVPGGMILNLGVK